MNEIERIKEIYETKYKVDPEDRSYMWHPRNMICFIFSQLLEFELISLLNKHNINLTKAKILDMGCGGGRLLRFFMEMGAQPSNLHGIDLMDYRIEIAKNLNPNISYQVCDAQKIPFEDETFDIVTQFVVFSSIHDDGIIKNISGEITRILKKDGIVIWNDLIKKVTKASHVRGFSKEEIKSFFPGCKILCMRAFLNEKIFRWANVHPELCLLLERIPNLKRTQHIALLKKL
ncbi:class I SAM-dependent methyltransferase [bacterium]|nr:class I SAM-dependent methyltransferase [bacterium]